jgi:drug/metabolite transporter (DMT)-like permease
VPVRERQRGAGHGSHLWGYAVRPIISTAGLLTAYYLLPLTERFTAATLATLGGGLLGVALLIVWHVRAILRSPRPRLRAVQALGVVLPLFLLLFAAAYYLLADSEPQSFTERLTRTDALYFTVTVFSTVGFGDITAHTELARLVTTGQMVSDLVVIGVAARVIVGAAQEGVRRQTPRQPPAT